MVVGWSMREDLRSELVVDAIQMALWRRQVEPGELVHHSDRGSQGGFKWSTQHLDHGGVDGQASGLDEGADGALADEVAGRSGAAEGDRARVLA
jgi:putative transposase